MDVVDFQEFPNGDFLTVNSQSILDTDTNTAFRDRLESNISNNSAVSSSPQIETFWNDSNAKIKNADIFLSQQNTETIDIFESNSTDDLRLGNETINYDKYDSDVFTGKNNSSQTIDVLKFDGEATSEDLDRHLMQQSDSLALENQSLLQNSDFNQALNRTNWLIGKKGKVREYDQNVEPVAYIKDVTGEGRQMYLKLPEEAKINYEDQLSLFQDVSNLKTDKVYAVEARVKWLNPDNKLPSAIVSFWAKNPDSSFRGKDFIITDGDGYKNIRFEFTPSQMGTTRFFLGLFTHVEGNIDDTEIYVDDYKVTEIGDIPSNLDLRKGNLLRDGGFNNYNATPHKKPSNRRGWNYTVNSSVFGLNQSIQTVEQNKLLRLEFPKAENYKDENNTSVTGVYQNVRLVGGQSYKLSADFHRQELDSFGSRENSLVQFIAYRKQTNGEDVFLGPIDVELTNNDLVSKSFNIIAPESGQYTILVRLAGWGNEGNGFVVDVDNVSLRVK